MLLIWTCGRTLLNPSWFFIAQHTTDFVPSEKSALSSFAHTYTSAVWDVPVSHPFSLAWSPLSWPFSTSPRRRSQPALSTLNHSRSWCEGHWVKPCVSICHLSLPVTMGCPQTLEEMRILHLLSAILFLQSRLWEWQEGWQTFGTIAQRLSSQHLHTWQKMARNPCRNSPDVLGQPCGKLPRPDLAKTCLEIPCAAGCFEQQSGVSCPCSLWELHLSQLREGTSKRTEGLPGPSKALEISG